MNTSTEQFEVWWQLFSSPGMEGMKEKFRQAYLDGYDYGALVGHAIRTNDPILKAP